MNSLVLALYAEGRTDERFLPVVIRRTAEQILAQRGSQAVDVPDLIVVDGRIHPEQSGRAERILEAARRAHGYHALIVHADADHPTPDRAMQERIRPGLDLVRQSSEAVCKQLVPIVPVQMTEAWMLADPGALCEVIGTGLNAHSLNLPEHADRVESDPNPKLTLTQVIQTALADRPRRRRRLDIGTLYEPLARQISLARLQAVPSYTRFAGDLTDLLIGLHMAL